MIIIMAEKNENEDLNQMKYSAEKRRQNLRKNKIQMMLMQRRNIFAKSNGEQMDKNHNSLKSFGLNSIPF